MSAAKKSDVPKLLKKVKVGRKPPSPAKGVTLLEQGVLAVIARDHTQAKSEAAMSSLRGAYSDWNEARVSQAQELAMHMRPSSQRKAVADGMKDWLPTARSVKAYLQEVFQKTHGLDIEFFADDLTSAGKLVSQMPELGLFDGSFLLWLAGGREMPVHTGLVRVLDRLGLISRTASMKKARSAIEPLVPKGEELLFAATFGHVSEQWCDSRKPLCHECPLVADCKHGSKVFADWKAQQVRLEAQRKKAEKQRIAAEKREEERRQRELERQKKRAEQMAKKLERERLKKKREEEKKKKAAAAAEAKRKEAEKRKKEAERQKKLAAEKKKREAEKKKAQAARKKAEAAKKKAQAAKKKVAAKKKAKKKATKKKTSSRRPVAKKKVTKKKASTRKPAAKKKTAKKVTKKKVTKKKTARKPAARKKTTRKPSRRR